jgi:hypothetical protein
MFESYESLFSDDGKHFSDESRRALSEIEEIRPYIDKIEFAAIRSQQAPKYVSTREYKQGVVKMRDALSKFVDLTRNGSWWSGNLVNDTAIEAGDEKFKPYAPNHNSAANAGLQHFIEEAELVTQLLTLTVKRFEFSRKGRMPNIEAQWLVDKVLKIFEFQGIRATTYPSGAYFLTLEIVFAELMPKLGPEAYRRYGAASVGQ